MRLNEFGKTARLLRMEHDRPLKEMADAMLISSAHLSALEYGDKKLNEGHIRTATQYFKQIGVPEARLKELQEAGAKSMESLNTKDMDANARAMVFAFARKLQEDGKPPASVTNWIKK